MVLGRSAVACGVQSVLKKEPLSLAHLRRDPEMLQKIADIEVTCTSVECACLESAPLMYDRHEYRTWGQLG